MLEYRKLNHVSRQMIENNNMNDYDDIMMSCYLEIKITIYRYDRSYQKPLHLVKFFKYIFMHLTIYLKHKRKLYTIIDRIYTLKQQKIN